MKDRVFLEQRARDVRVRLRRGSDAIGRELERTVGRNLRNHPRTGLAAGAVVGFVIGRTLRRAPAAGRSVAGPSPLTAIRGTLLFALRTAIVNALRPSRATRAEPRDH